MPKVLNKRHDLIPPSAVYVGRPTTFGNPYIIGKDGTREEVVAKYRELWLGWNGMWPWLMQELRGKDLVCWCAPLPCHADVLLEIANGPIGDKWAGKQS